jgi:hypothetical protein
MKAKLLEDRNAYDIGVFAVWVAGLLLIGGVLWYVAQPIRIGLLQKNVNTLLAGMGRSQRMEHPIPLGEQVKRRVPVGTWYALENAPGRAVVFALMSDGLRLPCVALVSQDGRVDEIIPLTPHVEQTVKRLPQGILRAYIRRIERDVQSFQENQ